MVEESLKIETLRFVEEGLERDLRFFVELGSPEVRDAFLDVLASAYPDQHAALIREVAGRVARGELDLTIIPRCPRCRRYHERSLC